jgi:cation-transporting ATPase 13A3/4/5
VILSGEAVMNESMLTGESNPVLKYAIPHSDQVFDDMKHKKFMLYCGTQVIQTKPVGDEDVRALVLRTGFQTSKGILFFSILFPKKIKFRFYTDSWWYLLIMSIIAIGCFTWSAIYLHKRGYPGKEIALSSLDLITSNPPLTYYFMFFFFVFFVSLSLFLFLFL